MILQVLLTLAHTCRGGEYDLDVRDMTVSGRRDLGDSVSMYGNIMVVGASRDHFNGYNSGSAYAYHRGPTGWSLQAILKSDDSETDDLFGFDVSVYDSDAVVSAIGDDSRGSLAGAVYSYQYNIEGNWAQKQKIVASDGVIGDRFGISVHVINNMLAVGASGDSSTAGAVYLFNRANSASKWVRYRKIEAADRDTSNLFGSAVCMTTSHLVIGAYGSDNLGFSSGAVYTFKAPWGNSAQATLTPHNGQGQDRFGFAVTASANTLLASSITRAGGLVYVFEYTSASWSEQASLLPITPAGAPFVAGAAFGYSLGVDSHIAVVGASGYDGRKGAAFVYTHATGGARGSAWTQQSMFAPSASNVNDDPSCGDAVAVSGSYLAFGAPGDALGSFGGILYSAHFTPAPTGLPTLSQNPTSLPTSFPTGAPSTLPPTITLSPSGVPSTPSALPSSLPTIPFPTARLSAGQDLKNIDQHNETSDKYIYTIMLVASFFVACTIAAVYLFRRVVHTRDHSDDVNTGGVDAGAFSTYDVELHPPMATAAIHPDVEITGSAVRCVYVSVSATDAVALPVAEATPVSRRGAHGVRYAGTSNVVTVSATALAV